MNRENSSGVLPIGGAPSADSLALSAGSLSTPVMSLCSAAITGFGVPAGTTMPAQELTSKPVTPDSATVGTSGKAGERDFVVTAMREQLKLSRSEMPRANEIHPHMYLDEGRLVRLKPDISRWEGSRCVAIGDVKYKPIADAGVIHADIYQILAYAVANELPEASLIYAMSKSEQAGLKL